MNWVESSYQTTRLFLGVFPKDRTGVQINIDLYKIISVIILVNKRFDVGVSYNKLGLPFQLARVHFLGMSGANVLSPYPQPLC